MRRSVQANLSSVFFVLTWCRNVIFKCPPRDRWMLSSGIFSSLGHCETCEILFLLAKHKVSVIWHWHWVHGSVRAQMSSHTAELFVQNTISSGLSRGVVVFCTCTGSRPVSGLMVIFTGPNSGSIRTDPCLSLSPVWTTSPSAPPSLNPTAWIGWRRWGL